MKTKNKLIIGSVLGIVVVVIGLFLIWRSSYSQLKNDVDSRMRQAAIELDEEYAKEQNISNFDKLNACKDLRFDYEVNYVNKFKNKSVKELKTTIAFDRREHGWYLCKTTKQ